MLERVLMKCDTLLSHIPMLILFIWVSKLNVIDISVYI